MLKQSEKSGRRGKVSADTRQHLRILLVDDEIDFTQVLIKRLTRRRMQVTVALSGHEAIRLLRRSDFDAVVLDLKLVDMDGIDILKIFKKMAPEVPVIMLTGHGSGTAAEEGIRYGAEAYLTKPCDIGDLVARIVSAAGKMESSDGPL